MKRFVLLLMMLLTARAWGAQSSSTIALSPDAVDRMTVYADHFEAGDGGNTMIASGQVHAVILQRASELNPAPPIAIYAGSLSANMLTADVTASDGVIVSSDGHVIHGDAATYNWKSQAGRVERITLSESGLQFRARSLDIGTGRSVMHDAVFSACGLDRPDYLIHASTVKLSDGRRVTARHITVEVFGHRIITLPSFAYGSRTRGAGQANNLPVPRPGHSRVSGFTWSQKVPVANNVDVDVQATTKVGLRGAFFYANEGRVTPYVELDWKQERSCRDRLPVLVSRLPEAGLRFGPHSEATVSAGYYREHTTRTRAGRADLTFDHVLVDRGERAGFRLTAGGRASAYTSGDSYKSARIEASVGRERASADVFELVGIRQNALQGHTPFQWDQIPIQTELFAGKRAAWGPFRFETGIRYDVGHHDIYAVEVAVARMLRCVEPEVRYNDHLRAVFFNVKMLH